MKPWGAPVKDITISDNEPFTLTRCELFVNKSITVAAWSGNIHIAVI